MDVDLRYEIKLVCEPIWLPQARAWIRLHPAAFAVAYPPRRVNSLYLDTLQLDHLNDNLSGLGDRHKLRLRWYGDESDHIQAQLEMKQKHNMLGWKETCALPERLDLTLPWGDILCSVCEQVGPAWQTLLQTIRQPTLINRYRREYYATPDGAVRVTLDFDQVAYDQRLFPRPNLDVRQPLADSVVIELKADRRQAERLEEIVAQFPLPRSRNSKYAQGVLAALG